MVLVYFSLGLVTVTLLLYAYLTRNFNYWKVRNVAGPKPLVLFGNLKQFTLRKKNLGSVYHDIYKQFPNEKVIGIYRMTTPCLFIRDLDAIKHIMIKDFDLFVDRGVEFSKEGLGANLFHADGDTWRPLRKRFTPLFTSSKLKNMLYLITERADYLRDYVDSICDDRPEQDIYGLMQKYTMATISACAFGIDIDTLNDKLETLHEIDKLAFTPSYANEIDMIFPGILKQFNSSIFPPLVRNFFYELVRNVVSERGGLPTERKDFMDLLLEFKQKGEIVTSERNDENDKLVLEITDHVIAAQAFIFYMAGYETTATTVSFLLYMLATNPHVQENLLAEIDQTLMKHNGIVNYDTIKSMQYLEKVFNETLRMFPVLDLLQRNAKADYTIPGTDVVVKKGMTVFVSPLGIHRDERYYPNPHIFDPERFSPTNSANRHPCAHIPFGVGPRNCIGMRFAKIQGSVGIVKLLSKVRVEPSKNTQKTMEFEPKRFLMAPKGGIYLNLIRRTPIKK